MSNDNAPQVEVVNAGGRPHGVTQHQELFGTEVAPFHTDSIYGQVPTDVNLDEVVEPADLSSGIGHRIQVQGVDAPPPAVFSFGSSNSNDFVNGVPPTREQLDRERAGHVTVDGRPVVEVEQEQAKQKASNRGR